MPTSSESQNNNPSEFIDDNNNLLSPKITNNIDGINYTVTSSNTSSLSPNGLIFSQAGISNAYASKVNGITDFTAYNDYIHHTNHGNMPSMPNIPGIPNVLSSNGGTRFNVYATLIKANDAWRFEIYNTKYRN